MIGHNVFITIDAGGTFLKSAVISDTGEVLNGSALTIEAYSGRSKEKILSAFKETIVKGLKFIETRGMDLRGIGIAFPGPFDYINGVPQMEHKFLNIYGFNLRNYFHEIPGVPPEIPVKFINDAQAVLSGELWRGNAMGFSNAAVVTLGTGLGFAYSKDGVVQCNNWGGPKVSIFRLPYKDGTLEDFTARRGFLKIYGDISGQNTDAIDVSDIGKFADAGDENSIMTFRKVAAILAEAIHDILIEKNIQCLLLGGQISRSFAHMDKTLKEGLSDIECLKRITMVKSIDSAALFGALRSLQVRLDMNVTP